MKKVMYASFVLALTLTVALACAKKPGIIEGKATLDGAAAGNAGVAISVAGTALTATTDDAGAYKIEGVTAGQYTVEAKKDGYDSKPLVGIVVEAGKTLSGQDINLTKIVPPAPEGATVPAGAPADPGVPAAAAPAPAVAPAAPAPAAAAPAAPAAPAKPAGK